LVLAKDKVTQYRIWQNRGRGRAVCGVFDLLL